MLAVCPVCGVENPEGSRFCNGCGSRLPERVALAEERKVVTALFCDLVGFTASSESADPEDVDRMLGRYSAIARRHIEAHGGVVEKFIGDAVVGVFGVPQAHEDDPERAVRAALRIAEDAGTLPALHGAPLRLRIGIDTGEVLVRLNVTPGAGERFLAGDAVNTASRIQSVAPEMGVAVGQATYQATKHRFEYEELPPAGLKGKREPVRVFRPIAPRSRPGIDVSRPAATPFVGRSMELGRLTHAFDETVARRGARFASIVGPPGLGKSRLVSELLGYVDAAPILATWRQGRCLPYGTGISFWALGEVVKAHAGILESDPTDVALMKLDRVLGETEDRAWLRERLQPLLGIESGPAAGRDELFAAWRRFLELLAEDRPTVLVFEDLHWADEAMLAFIEDLATRPADVPLFVLGTTRPELFDRRPGFPGSGAADRIDLRPLSTDAARDLAHALLDGVDLADEVREPILDRAGGNPLFVEEFIRLLRDRDLLVSIDGRLDLREGSTLPVPDSIQALLAARLDALPAAAKSVLTDAAVVGKTFWGGAVTTIGGRDQGETDEQLDLLAAREFVRVAPASSMADETEYAFWHVLVRDVAYGALPRAARASRHVAAARWIEARAGDRVEDVADVLAHHYTTALELSRALDDDVSTAALEAPARRFLLLAGERVLDLDVAAATALLERALALAPPGHPDRAAVLRRLGQAFNGAGRSKDAELAFEEALAAFRAANDVQAAADVLTRLSSTWRDLHDPRGWTAPSEIVSLLEDRGPSRQLAEALVLLAFALMDDRLAESLILLDRAAAMAAALPDTDPRAALAFRGGLLGVLGMAHATDGDERGVDELREGLRDSIAAGDSNRAGHTSQNLAQHVYFWQGPRSAASVVAEGIAFATSRGLQRHVVVDREIEVLVLSDLGDHDRLLAEGELLAATLETKGWVLDQVYLTSSLFRVETLRGTRIDATRLSRLEELVRSGSLSDGLMGIAGCVPAYLLRGDRETARALIVEIAPSLATRVAAYWWPRELCSLVRAALELDEIELAASLVDGFVAVNRYANHAKAAARAAVLEARGDLPAAIAGYEDAAGRWAAFGVVPEQAFALLGWGRSLVASGRVGEAREPLVQAREIFSHLNAAPSLREIDRLVSSP